MNEHMAGAEPRLGDHNVQPRRGNVGLLHASPERSDLDKLLPKEQPFAELFCRRGRQGTYLAMDKCVGRVGAQERLDGS